MKLPTRRQPTKQQIETIARWNRIYAEKFEDAFYYLTPRFGGGSSLGPTLREVGPRRKLSATVIDRLE